MKFNIAWGSHLPVLMKVMELTNGSVLELGGGLYSTPYLHWSCFPNKRELVTYDYQAKYFNLLKNYESDFHKVIMVEDWDKVDIDRNWDVVLVDHDPAERRIEEIKRLANLAKYIVVHDTQKREEKHYHYNEIYPLFKYQYKYREVKPHTSVLSNFVDLSNFEI